MLRIVFKHLPYMLLQATVVVAAALAGIKIAETSYTESTFTTYVPAILVAIVACYPRLSKMRAEMVVHSNREYLSQWDRPHGWWKNR